MRDCTSEVLVGGFKMADNNMIRRQYYFLAKNIVKVWFGWLTTQSGEVEITTIVDVMLNTR